MADARIRIEHQKSAGGENIGDLQAEVRKRNGLNQTWNRQTKALLGKLFYNGIREGILSVESTPEEALLKLLKPLRKQAYAWYKERELVEGRIPFLIVFPRQCMSIENQLFRVTIGGNYPTMPSMLSSTFNSPGVKQTDKPYLVFDVEDGSATAPLQREKASEAIEELGRLPLTVEETFALLVHHPEVIKKHWIDILGSKCGLGHTPSFWIPNGKPEYSHGVKAKPGWRFGAPSCVARSIV